MSCREYEASLKNQTEAYIESIYHAENMNYRHDNESSDMKPRDNNPSKHARNNSQPVFPVLSVSKALKEKRSNYTHPVAFNFKCDERAERRKEFNLRLEEKNKAKEEERKLFLEKAKIEFEAEIRELRKSLVFKANPVPSFYHEGIPAKVKMNKIPPKSSEFRRRSRSEGGTIMDHYSRAARDYGNGMGSKASSSPSSCRGGGYAKLRVRHGSHTSFGSHDEDLDGTPSSHQTNNMENNYGNIPYHDHQDDNKDDDDDHYQCRVDIQES